ncbi:MAG: heavy metal translocating P-type ATPase [Wenzhouxiangellaceae bacterium]|nr:heavy metal translocating P-type ATPase [Wenzhouxiangellaceae bacterium]
MTAASSRPAAPADPVECFHCGEPVPPGVELFLEIDQQPRPMCCAGCRAVASLIRSAGLKRYYDFRDALPERPEGQGEVRDFRAWDRPAVLEHHAQPERGGALGLVLVLENVHCAACAWLVQRYLQRFAGVEEARLDVADGRLKLVFDPARTPLSTLAAALMQLGYPPHLDTPDSTRERDRGERRRMLKYLVVSALGMMQVMSYALANYIGAFQGIDPETEHFFKLVSMIVAVPVALYAGQPFYRAALAHLAERRLGLDVPVAAAILLALFSSVLITLFGSGEVYFDSVVMFIFFLLLGRFAVMLARQQSGALHSALARALPDQARRLTAAGSEAVGRVELQAGDRVLVADGEIVPADGRVLDGRARVDESLLSGESEPRPRGPGDAVLAGSLVTGGALTIELEQLGRGTVLAGIVDLLAEARRQRPRLARLADRAAGVFIAVILVAATLAALYWAQTEPVRVIPIVLAMLVVACPCALALGTPTALAAATRSLAANGVLTANPDALELLPRVTHVMLDKTGTLTEPGMRVVEVSGLVGLDREHALEIAGALQRVSTHPIARAFRAHDPGVSVEAAESLASRGVAGTIEGVVWRLGRPDWAADGIEVPNDGIWLALAGGDGARALFRVDAGLRPGAQALVGQLQSAGVQLLLASGDRRANVAAMAARLGLEEWHAELTPADKLALAERLRAQGAIVAMVGDGINDAPVLAGADISIALAEASAIARTQADLICTGRSLDPLRVLFDQAPRVRRIIRQNLVWALGYNLSALPLAAAGLVPPWAAAIGMSASSLAVVLNARRLGRARVQTGERAPNSVERADPVSP